MSFSGQIQLVNVYTPIILPLYYNNVFTTQHKVKWEIIFLIFVDIIPIQKPLMHCIHAYTQYVFDYFRDDRSDRYKHRERRFRSGIPDVESYNDFYHNTAGSQYSAGSMRRLPVNAPMSFPNFGTKAGIQNTAPEQQTL